MIRYVGIDLHKHLLVMCVVDSQGKILLEKRLEKVDAASLQTFFQSHLSQEDEVALEATSHVWAVVEILKRHAAKVVVSNPVTTKAIAQAKVKTDKVDARVLAHLLRLDFLPTVWQPDQELQRLRELTQRRGRLISQRSAILCRIRSTLLMRLLDCPCSVSTPRGHAWLKEVALDEDGRWLIDSDLRLLEAVQKEIQGIDERLLQRVHAHAQMKLLLTLPGVGIQVALALLAAIGDISRFPSPEKLANYLGLTPSTRQSANRCYHGPITKAGRSQTRAMLAQAAQTVRMHPGPLGHFFHKVRKRKCHGVAIVATARKLAMLAWHVLTTERPYRYAQPKATQDKLASLRIAGGVRRKGSPPKGVDPRTRRTAAEKVRRIPGITESLQKEGLPAPLPAPPGEMRMLESIGKIEYYQRLDEVSTRPRNAQQRTRPSYQPPDAKS